MNSDSRMPVVYSIEFGENFELTNFLGKYYLPFIEYTLCAKHLARCFINIAFIILSTIYIVVVVIVLQLLLEMKEKGLARSGMCQVRGVADSDEATSDPGPAVAKACAVFSLLPSLLCVTACHTFLGRT